MQRRISVITISFNNKIGLERTILSVTNQIGINAAFEYIVIDGGSNDGSKEIIEKYSDKIRYWVSEPDKGIYNAMNKGIQKATGDYLLFMNSGDVLVEDNAILQSCQEKLQEDIVAFDSFLERDGKIVSRRTHIEKPTLFYAFCRGFKHQSTFIKKSLFDIYGLYDERYKIAGDYEFWIRALLQPKTIAKSYTLPIAIFELGGISQNSDYMSEHRRIEQELLPHLIDDFRFFQKLLPYQHSRILQKVIKFQKGITKFRAYFKK